MLRPVAVIALLLLAGCSGSTPEPTSEARDAVAASRDAVHDRFDYLLFLGVTGTEGDLDWDRYEAALMAADDPGKMIAEGFDQDVDNGAPADGRLGSWLTTHFVFDEERRLLGGLYTQYTPERIHSVYAPFRGPYAGTLALPMLAQTRMAEESTLCGLLSDTRSWEVDSKEAMAIARERPIMQAHMEMQPAGEFTYYYFPHLDVEPDCPVKMNTESNYWIISHTDLDEYLDGGTPTVAEVRIDAETGLVMDEQVRPIYMRPPTVFNELITYEDDLPGGTTFTNLTVEIPPGATSFDVFAKRNARPTTELAAETRIIAPHGIEQDSQPFTGGQHGYHFEDPMPGVWTITYYHEPLVPGEHAVEIRGAISYT